MNGRTEAMISVLMALFVVIYSRLDSHVAAALATVFLIVFAFYKIRQPGQRTR